MDERDLQRALRPQQKREGAEFYEKLKTSGIKHPHLASAAVGAGIGVGIHIAKHKKNASNDGAVNAAFKGALAAGGTSLAAEKVLKKLTKTAAPTDRLKVLFKQGVEMGKTLVKTKRPEMIGAAAAAALAGATTYGASKRWGGKPSFEETVSDRAHKEHSQFAEQQRQRGQPLTYGQKKAELVARAHKDFAKIMADHPARAAGSIAAAAAPVGWGLGRALVNLARKA